MGKIPTTNQEWLDLVIEWRREARLSTIEECASIAEQYAGPKPAKFSIQGARVIAAAIRALGNDGYIGNPIDQGK